VHRGRWAVTGAGAGAVLVAGGAVTRRTALLAEAESGGWELQLGAAGPRRGIQGDDEGGRVRRERGALERAVLLAVEQASQRAEGALTVAEVAAALDGDPAYTTVLTTLTRLHDKGALTREPRGRGFAYALAAAPAAVDAARTARQMRRLLEAEGRRDDVLARFVAELDPADATRLRRFLADDATPGASAPPAAGTT
jgi:predicted transcriptional regulator